MIPISYWTFIEFFCSLDWSEEEIRKSNSWSSIPLVWSSHFRLAWWIRNGMSLAFAYAMLMTWSGRTYKISFRSKLLLLFFLFALFLLKTLIGLPNLKWVGSYKICLPSFSKFTSKLLTKKKCVFVHWYSTVSAFVYWLWMSNWKLENAWFSKQCHNKSFKKWTN